jgi:hypothetical protein
MFVYTNRTRFRKRTPAETQNIVGKTSSYVDKDAETLKFNKKGFFKVSLSGNFSYICHVDKKKKQRTIIFYKNYFDDFFKEQKQKIKDKIIWTFDLRASLKTPRTLLFWRRVTG